MTENFVLCPARHSHKKIDGLKSVFMETEDVFNLKFTEDFKNYLANARTCHINIYVTGLTPAYEKCRDELDHNGASYTFYHYDRSIDDYRTV